MTASQPPIAAVFMVTAPVSLPFVVPIATGIAERGYSVALACGVDPNLEPEWSNGLRRLNVPHLQRSPSPYKDLRAFSELVRLFRALRPVLVDVSTPKAGVLGTMAARATGVPCCIYTLRGLRLEGAQPLAWPLLYLAEQFACRSAHRVVAVGPSLLERAIRLRLVKRGRAEVVGDGSGRGVDTARFRPDPGRAALGRAVREGIGVAAHTKVIGYVGRIVVDKGIEQLLDAHEALQAQGASTHLLLVGDVDLSSPLRPALMKRLLQQRAVTITGWVAHVERYLWAMDLFVLPSWREGFPVCALEAQAAGVPVITTSATGARDAVVPGETGLIVPPRDSAQLLEAMMRLLRDPDLAAKMAAAAAERVASRFERRLVVESLVDFYERQIQHGSARARLRRAKRPTARAPGSRV